MALYDQFNASQVNNGVGPANPQATTGAPGYNVGAWGNLPGGLAGGLQAFMAGRGAPLPNQVPGAGMMPTRPPLGIATGAPGIFSGPVPATPAPAITAPAMGQPTMGQPIAGAPVNPGGGGMFGAPNMAGAPNAAGGGMPANFAGGMRPYLGG
jgi:hypothetical protein